MEETQDAGPRRMSGKPVDPRLLRYASASRWFFVAIGAIALAQTAVIVAFAWLLTRAITGAIDGMPWPELAPTLGALGVVVGLRALLMWTRETVAAHAAARVQLQLRAALIDAIGRLGPEWLGARNSAALGVTAGRGLEALEAYFGRYLPQLVQTVVATPLIIAVMWWQDWISGLTVLLTLPLIPIFMVLIGLATRSVQQRQWRTLQHLASRFADTVQGLSTLKVFGRQHRAAASIERVTGEYRRETMRVLRVSFLSGFALEFLASISVAIVAVSIGFRLIDGALTLAVGLFVLLLAPEAYLPLRQVGVQFHAAAEGVAATDDVFDVLDTARGTAVSLTLSRSPVTNGRGERQDATGEQRERLILDGVRVRRGERMLPPVDLTAAPGTVTLIEGPSGAGKSSLFAALRGAAAFEGTASWAGADLRALAPSAWLAWAGQQPGLLTGSIADNVALGDPAPDSALMRRALDLACAGSLDPDQELGVQGAGLSGGQAQRVAVARAFYRHLRGAAPVIALDEPSSALDPRTEERLWRGLRHLADEGATVLLISHRISARDVADAVVRLEPSEVPA
ncbi:thiol reductant ABC exporter subunit CydD [Microbacterium sp. M3]|uniref:Thiol reductant ABC exporter subunit CydD n=1 Tax=Microbacterium arthrosphaerae TaxID=792652 RepID=A0ABU4H154_9MICO|nr:MULTISPECIES: thiol reductant ABC exporter subunit CydD [Microbacterium]MDW4571624.1 thiol reductant ABC exporter subunit CydD [Microbacterium arthrosphaerae]MDW7605479.1 thiol reductant ABC exporter subunit CydD [Microbacterium sp. M3]